MCGEAGRIEMAHTLLHKALEKYHHEPKMAQRLYLELVKVYRKSGLYDRYAEGTVHPGIPFMLCCAQCFTQLYHSTGAAGRVCSQDFATEGRLFDAVAVVIDDVDIRVDIERRLQFFADSGYLND